MIKHYWRISEYPNPNQLKSFQSQFWSDEKLGSISKNMDKSFVWYEKMMSPSRGCGSNSVPRSWWFMLLIWNEKIIRLKIYNFKAQYNSVVILYLLITHIIMGVVYLSILSGTFLHHITVYLFVLAVGIYLPCKYILINFQFIVKTRKVLWCIKFNQQWKNRKEFQYVQYQKVTTQ